MLFGTNEELQEGATYPGYLLGVRAFQWYSEESQRTRKIMTPRQFLGYDLPGPPVLKTETYTHHEIKVSSPTYPFTWKPGVNVATHVDPYTRIFGRTPSTVRNVDGSIHRAPQSNCSCGFYVYGTPHQADRFSNHATNSVMGIVKASGRIIVGTLGFRAEKVEIVGLFPWNPDESDVALNSTFEKKPYRGFSTDWSVHSNRTWVEANKRLMAEMVWFPYPVYDTLQEAVEAARDVT